MTNKLQQVVLMVSTLFMLGIQAGLAQTQQQKSASSNIPSIRDIKLPLTSAEMLVQSQAPQNPALQEGKQKNGIVPITGVKANPTDKGVEVILETPVGTQLQVTNRSVGSNFIVDVSGGQLRLPSGKAFTFRSEKPLAGITQITVTNIDANIVQVTVVGEKALPIVELFDDNAGLVFAVASTATATSPPQPTQTPQASQPENQTQPTQPSTSNEPIELVVTGEQDGYNAPNASIGTKTDTPLRDIPQSIQVVPQQVIKDQQLYRLGDVLKNVPGVVQSGSSPRSVFESFTIRGFDAGGVLKDGLLDSTLGSGGYEPVTVERIEVLKGPASVLFGPGALGGIVNIVTKQPLREPYYFIEGSAGSYNSYRGAIDLSGPINADKTVLYRLGVAARTTESFIDFYQHQFYNVSPSLTWQINDRAKLTLAAQYYEDKGPFDYGLPADGTVFPNPNGKIPRNRFRGEPSVDDSDSRSYRVGYNFEYRFSDNWQVRSALQTSFLRLKREAVFGSLAADERTFNRDYGEQNYKEDVYNFDTYVVGKFATGSIQHQLVTGLNLSRDDTFATNISRAIASLDLFNPQYGSRPTGPAVPELNYRNRSDLLGIYVQDQITLADNLKVLLGGRFDIVSNDDRRLDIVSSSFRQDEAFSPRLGIVYQPIRPISLYASYSKSFLGSSEGEPERGTQYEVGVKADLSSRLSATLAFYNLTRSNLPTEDPNNPLLTILVGEQRSRGIEFDVTGEISPGWNVIAGYAYTDAEVTKDNTIAVGNQINNIPKNSFNLWTTYEIQSGALQGFGAGLGFYFVGDRQGDLDNTFQIPSYFRTDAALFYKHGQLRAGLNFKNLFDIDYFDSASFRDRVFYGDPFTVQGTISWEF
ncbi:TonB-dependent siderophore receptor [Nostoc sp.]|uniref:TonB-dependent siderophore receptor n=1 Tax=Nostoc sp. TaxID=1180 RepID=UPI002FF8E9C3